MYWVESRRLGSPVRFNVERIFRIVAAPWHERQ
jgi:hypothetical protein